MEQEKSGPVQGLLNQTSVNIFIATNATYQFVQLNHPKY